jgi:hypothetical protein
MNAPENLLAALGAKRDSDGGIAERSRAKL